MKNNLGSTYLLPLRSSEVLLRLIFSCIRWKIVTAGFEAATIGGFADWFAVSALFHEIPTLCPQAYKHYSKKQRKLTEGIVDLSNNGFRKRYCRKTRRSRLS
jgi:uncharacterized membrane-anchored protein YjiN (DUF445 family)